MREKVKEESIFGDLFEESKRKALERAYHPSKDKKSKWYGKEDKKC